LDKIQKKKIFVSIVAFRDPEIIPTLIDAISKARDPQEITFCVIWQYDQTEQEDLKITNLLRSLSLLESHKNHQIKVVEINQRDSLGVCWARSLAQRMLYDEDLVLQLDSHHRFVENWDYLLIELLEKCASQKPILSGYVPSYTPPNFLSEDAFPARLGACQFDNNGILTLASGGDDLSGCQKPQLGMFLAGGFIFTLRNFYLEVLYDPFLYFTGEELTLSLRAWTNGWNIYYPNKIILYHYYLRENSKKHWDVDPNWYRLEEKSRKRILVQTGCSKNSLENLEIYGLGKERTLGEYQEFAGIDFKKKTISNDCKRGIPQIRSS